MTTMEKAFIVIDATSYLYRAYHAMPNLTNKQGEPTGAIYGVLNMLRRMEAEYQSDQMVCVFDGKGPTFRHHLYPEYKATRPPTPEDLILQIQPLYDCVRALGWPMIISDGVEADDVIGTLAAEASKSGIHCWISTGDKDMAQLVNDHVTLINTMSNETLDENGVLAKFGVKPDQIVDYLTLIGDQVDNVPGVRKVGPKTAVKWLTQYGSLNNIIDHAAEIGGVVGQNLRDALEWLPKARELLTIKTDVANLPALNDLCRQSLDVPTIQSLFQRLGFKSWLKEYTMQPIPESIPYADNRLDNASADLFDNQPDSAPIPQHVENTDTLETPAQYETILSVERLSEWIERLYRAEETAIDTETTSLNPLLAELVGISFSVTNGEAAYLPLAHTACLGNQIERNTALSLLKDWLESEAHKKIGQNIKYDCHIFENYGITLRGIQDDTMIAAYLLESHLPSNMDALAERYLNRQTITYESVCGKGAKQIPFAEADFELACRYAAEDAEVTFELNRQLKPKLTDNARLLNVYQTIEMPVISILQRMERDGVLINVFQLAEQSERLAEQLSALEKEAYDIVGRSFNVNSTKQLREIFFDQLHLPVSKKTPGGVPSVDETVLEKLADDHPLPRILLEHRTLSKLKSTYVDKLPQMVNPKTGRIHTTYAQSVAVTGRLASSEPNLQNIPIRTEEGRKIREAFIAPTGYQLISADYSQIELRIMAHLSGDENLLSAFAEGKDVHQATAAEIFGISLDTVSSEQRRMAKAINFGLIYGMSAFGLARQIGVDRQSAAAYMDRYFARYPKVAEYMHNTRLRAKEQGYVETLFGRRVWAPDILASNAIKRQAAERAAINAPMQGTAADLIKLAMISVANWLQSQSLKAKMIMQVHDELIFEVPEDEIEILCAALPKLLENAAQLSVPLLAQIGIGKNWDEAH